MNSDFDSVCSQMLRHWPEVYPTEETMRKCWTRHEEWKKTHQGGGKARVGRARTSVRKWGKGGNKRRWSPVKKLFVNMPLWLSLRPDHQSSSCLLMKLCFWFDLTLYFLSECNLLVHFKLGFQLRKGDCICKYPRSETLTKERALSLALGIRWA